MRKFFLFCASSLFLFASPLYAAPAYVASSFACVNGTSPQTLSSVAVSAGQTLIVGVSIITGGATQIATIAFNGSESFTKFNEIHDGMFVRGELWGLLAPTATTANIVVTDNGGGAEIQACVSRFTGVGSFGTSVEAAATSGTPTVTCSSASGQLVVDVTAQFTGAEALGTAGAGQTAAGANDTGSAIFLGTGISYENGGASVVMSWSNTMNEWADVCVSLVPPASSRKNLSLLGV
jgi:hypothetical protein